MCTVARVKILFVVGIRKKSRPGGWCGVKILVNLPERLAQTLEVSMLAATPGLRC